MIEGAAINCNAKNYKFITTLIISVRQQLNIAENICKTYHIICELYLHADIKKLMLMLKIVILHHCIPIITHIKLLLYLCMLQPVSFPLPNQAYSLQTKDVMCRLVYIIKMFKIK